MYAMSWERDASSYKYESIQHGYEVQFDEYEDEERDLSLEELLELEEEELAIEEMF